jgi:hypothetical protein
MRKLLIDATVILDVMDALHVDGDLSNFQRDDLESMLAFVENASHTAKLKAEIARRDG